METQQQPRFKILGINQDKDFCECCGKTGIQSVVWIEDTQTNIVKHFGQVCASKPAKGFDCNVKKAISDLKSTIKQIVTPKALMTAYRDSGGTHVDPNNYDFTPTDLDLWKRIHNELMQKAYELNIKWNLK